MLKLKKHLVVWKKMTTFAVGRNRILAAEALLASKTGKC
jgi:hypothetical protein